MMGGRGGGGSRGGGGGGGGGATAQTPEEVAAERLREMSVAAAAGGPPLNAAEEAQLRAALDQGMPFSQAAQAIRDQRATVEQARLRAQTNDITSARPGAPNARPGRGMVPPTNDLTGPRAGEDYGAFRQRRADTIRDMTINGRSVSEIARVTGLSKEFVRNGSWRRTR